MSKAITYLRVSTEEQAEKGFSLLAQRAECKQKAENLNCLEMTEFCDEGVSGSILERPKLLSALEYIKLQAVDFFICYDPSRLSRNVSHQLILIDTIKKSNTKLVFVRSSYEDTAEGRFQITIMAAVDEYERARLKIRTELGKRAKANQHLLTHNPNLYGYEFDKDSDTMKVNQDQAQIIQMMYQWLLTQGIGPSAIADKLNELSIPSMRGKLWSRVSVNRMLRNYSYTGTLYIRRYDTKEYKLNKFRKKEEKIKIIEKPREQWIPITIPTIIDTATWLKAKCLLDKSKRIYKGKNKQFLLSGLISCGTCGGTMFGKTAAQNRYYCCINKYNYKKEKYDRCQSTLYNAEELDNLIWNEIKSRLLIKEKIIRTLNDESNCLSKTLTSSNISKIRKMKLQAELERERISILFQKSIINEAELDEKICDLNKRISILNQDEQEFNKEIVITNPQTSFDRIEKYINSLNTDNKNKLIHSFISDIIIYNDKIDIKLYIPTQ